jgi:hypothetical protein
MSKRQDQFKVRNILLTLNQPENFEEVKKYLIEKPSFQYGLAAKEEAPTTGHKHIHFYIQFNKPTTIQKSKLLGSHLDICKGSPQQNINYVKKDGDIIFEEGTPKLKGGKTIKEVMEMKPEERLNLPACYYNICQKIKAEEEKDLKGDEMYKEMKVHWYWGDSGLGKTRRAYKEIGSRTFNEVKFDGNFWHGAKEGGTIALYDDFRDSDMKPRELINFIDYNKHIMNIKGGSCRNTYTEIFITSIQSPEEIYKNVEGEPRRQWLRRLTDIIHFEAEVH